MKSERKEYIRRWQRECLKKRRIQWLKDNGPCRHCGSWDRLEVDHINRENKSSHRVWSWNKDKRESELKKCQPLCYKCHKTKSAKECRELYKDKPRITSQIVPDYKFIQVIELLKTGLSQRKACVIVGMSRSTFSSYKYKGLRKHILASA